jgi:hypothetical protein
MCTNEERRDIGWWKMDVWKLKGMSGNIDHIMCSVCRKEEE